MIAQVLTKARRLMVKTKQCDRKEPVTVTPFALQSNCVGDGAIYSGIPNCCERKWAVDRAVTDHGDLTVKIRNRWTENFPDENKCDAHDV